jgi:hypothetical protein
VTHLGEVDEATWQHALDAGWSTEELAELFAPARQSATEPPEADTEGSTRRAPAAGAHEVLRRVRRQRLRLWPSPATRPAFASTRRSSRDGLR